MHKIVILSLLSSMLSIADQSIQTKKDSVSLPSGSVINFTIYNSQDAKSNNSTTVSQTQISKPSEETPLFNKISQLLNPKTGFSDNGFLQNYKWHLLLATLGISYGYLWYYLASANNYLGQQDLWSSWRVDLPLDQLLAIPQAQFAQELVREIQRRYTDTHSITDLVRPLALFMARIEQEEEQIKSYQSVFAWLAYLKLEKLVPSSKARFAKIPERLQRIAYYRNVFQSWAADYQLKKATQASKRADFSLEGPDMAPIALFLREQETGRILAYWARKTSILTPAYQ